MGLKENRLIAHIQENEYPFHQRTFEEATGAPLEIEVDFDAWSQDHEGLLNLNGYVLGQFTEIIPRIAVDDLGKEALRESVKKLKVTRVDDAASKSMTLENGVLHLAVAPAAGFDGVFRNSEIKEYLTDHL